MLWFGSIVFVGENSFYIPTREDINKNYHENWAHFVVGFNWLYTLRMPDKETLFAKNSNHDGVWFVISEQCTNVK